jgi:hypothetical protein
MFHQKETEQRIQLWWSNRLLDLQPQNVNKTQVSVLCNCNTDLETPGYANACDPDLYLFPFIKNGEKAMEMWSHLKTFTQTWRRIWKIQSQQYNYLNKLARKMYNKD